MKRPGIHWGIRLWFAFVVVGGSCGGVALLLAACMAPKAPEGKILIEFWDFPRLPEVQEWLSGAIDEYERLHPEVHIEHTRLSWSKGGERMDIAAFAGRPPDVAGSVLNLKYVQAGLLAPLDEYLDEEIPGQPGVRWRDDIHPPILADMQWDGTTWGFPWYKEAFVLLMNKDLFEERGVPLPTEGRWTWDEFLVAMRKLTFDRDGDGTIDVYGIGYNTGRTKWEAYPFLFGEGMRILSNDQRKSAIGSEATLRGINRLLDLEYTEKVALPGAGGFLDSTTWEAFSGPEARLAVTSQGLWSVKAAEARNRKVEETRRNRPDEKDAPEPLRIALALNPQMPGQPQRMASYGVGCYMVFNRPYDPKRTEAAARFARYLTLEVGQEINRAAGVFPSRISYKDLYKVDPLYSPILPYIPDAISPPVHPAWFQIDQMISDQLQLALLRAVPPETAVANMEERIQMILDDYWAGYDAERAPGGSE